LHKLTEIPLIQLVDDEERPYDLVACKDSRPIAELLNPAGLAEIATYAQGIGPSKNLIVPRDKQGKMLPPTSLIADAHKVGLLVHPYTFRNENAFLPLDFRSKNSSDPSVNDAFYGDAFAEYKLFYDLGVDGVFSESPDTALEARSLLK
jgi:glycerophosphoryl diester phosphodiesterase